MAKEIKVRSQQKNGTSSDWAKATNFTPLLGELIIYNDKKNLKVGDGTTKVGSLGFLMEEMDDAKITELYNSNNVLLAEEVKL